MKKLSDKFDTHSRSIKDECSKIHTALQGLTQKLDQPRERNYSDGYQSDNRSGQNRQRSYSTGSRNYQDPSRDRPPVRNYRDTRRPDGGIVCYSCNEPGHYSTYCPQKTPRAGRRSEADSPNKDPKADPTGNKKLRKSCSDQGSRPLDRSILTV